MKLGSLFDGSGTCPLAARMCGIEPVWASEIEPYPIRVTQKNFPGMRHLGDVKRIDGAKIEPVDVITFGSPCQDLSTAGRQAGLINGERSSLFFEAIQIIREMREATDGKYPRYAVWENVPGAFGSNRGRDFLAVLRAFAGVAGDGDDVPAPEGKGDRLGWSKSGCIMGDGYSIAWRQLDAQYWGVPQRRRRIYLVADFAGQRAGKILFERESLRGDFAPGAAARQRAAAETAGSAGGSDQPAEVIGAFMAGQGAKAGSIAYSETIAPTICVSSNRPHAEIMTDKAPTLLAQSIAYMCRDSNQIPLKIDEARPPRKYILRRLTPLECCRLQGFPDDWTAGVEGSDAAQYKMWGNGMALPCVLYVMQGIAEAGGASDADAAN